MTADPDYLWLMPECCADLEGRHWSVADDFDCDDGVKSTKYIRSDLKAPVTSELLEAAKEALHVIEGIVRFVPTNAGALRVMETIERLRTAIKSTEPL